MTVILTIPDTYADACPSCAPGDSPASLPIGYPEEVPGGILTAHQCEVCGEAWSTLWDHCGWAIDRMRADVTDDQKPAASRKEAA